MAEKNTITVLYDKAQDSPGIVSKPSHDSFLGQANNVRELEGIRVIGMSDEECDFFHSFTPEMRKRLNHKIDWRLLPALCAMWFVSHLDRGNIANAKIVGMDKDLHLTGTQYNAALVIFFISYILFEIPSNIILKKVSRPSWYLGGLVVAFGLVVIFHGLVQNFSGLAGCRFMLGVFEAGLFPAGLYLCGFWYMPQEMGLRTGIFWSLSSVSGAFAGLLAAGIQQMGGVGGYEGWRWIFILEGLFSMAVGGISMYVMVDIPSNKLKWLEPDELRFLEICHVIKQGGRNKDGVDVEGGLLKIKAWTELKAVASDWTMYAFGFLNFCIATAFYGFKFALPTITSSMGFNSTTAQLLSVPPYIVGGVATIIIAYISDRMKKRAIWNMFNFAFTVVGHAVLLGLRGNYTGARLGVGYTFLFFMAIGVHAGIPPNTAWLSNNSAPSGRRAIACGWLITLGNMGGIVGSFMYLDREAPAYSTGFGIGAGMALAGFVVSIFLLMVLKRRNERNAARSEEMIREHYSDNELLRLGNKSPLFRYAL